MHREGLRVNKAVNPLKLYVIEFIFLPTQICVSLPQPTTLTREQIFMCEIRINKYVNHANLMLSRMTKTALDLITNLRVN